MSSTCLCVFAAALCLKPLFKNGVQTSTWFHQILYNLISSCRYFESLVTKEKRRTFRFNNNLSYDLSRQQYLCPLCKTISNTVIPLIPSLQGLIPEEER